MCGGTLAPTVPFRTRTLAPHALNSTHGTTAAAARTSPSTAQFSGRGLTGWLRLARSNLPLPLALGMLDIPSCLRMHALNVHCWLLAGLSRPTQRPLHHQRSQISLKKHNSGFLLRSATPGSSAPLSSTAANESRSSSSSDGSEHVAQGPSSEWPRRLLEIPLEIASSMSKEGE
jgi:hypothetical protein